jgi:hypothetical protein
MLCLFFACSFVLVLPPQLSADWMQLAHQSACPPHALHTTTLIREFLSALAIAGKSVKKLQETVFKVYGNKAQKRTKIYEIIKKLKERKPSADQMGLN